jgi:hypothetical protein
VLTKTVRIFNMKTEVILKYVVRPWVLKEGDNGRLEASQMRLLLPPVKCRYKKKNTVFQMQGEHK